MVPSAAVRRQALASVTRGGLVADSSVVGSAVDRQVTLAVEKRPDGSYRRSEVPADWWAQFSRARRVTRELQTAYDGVPAVKDVCLRRDDERIRGFHLGAVTVYLDPEVDAGVDVPDAVDDVPVRTDAYDPGTPDLCNTNRYDPVPGGVAGADANGVGTFTCRILNRTGDEAYLLHCAHTFDVCEGNPLGREAYQAGQYVGRLYGYDASMDVASVELTADAAVSGYSAEILGTDLPVRGHVTEDGAAAVMGAADTVFKYGRSTCETSGELVELYRTNGLRCDSPDDDWLTCTMETRPGDSGAAYFVRRTDPTDREGGPYAAVLGVHSKSTSRHRFGCAAYRVHELYEVLFG